MRLWPIAVASLVAIPSWGIACTAMNMKRMDQYSKQVRFNSLFGDWDSERIHQSLRKATLSGKQIIVYNKYRVGYDADEYVLGHQPGLHIIDVDLESCDYNFERNRSNVAFGFHQTCVGFRWTVEKKCAIVDDIADTIPWWARVLSRLISGRSPEEMLAYRRVMAQLPWWRKFMDLGTWPKFHSPESLVQDAVKCLKQSAVPVCVHVLDEDHVFRVSSCPFFAKNLISPGAVHCRRPFSELDDAYETFREVLARILIAEGVSSLVSWDRHLPKEIPDHVCVITP